MRRKKEERRKEDGPLSTQQARSRAGPYEFKPPDRSRAFVPEPLPSRPASRRPSRPNNVSRTKWAMSRPNLPLSPVNQPPYLLHFLFLV